MAFFVNKPKVVVSFPGEPAPVDAIRVSGTEFRNFWRFITSAPLLPTINFVLDIKDIGDVPGPALGVPPRAAICAVSEAIIACNCAIVTGVAGTAGLTVGTAGVAGVAKPPPPPPKLAIGPPPPLLDDVEAAPPQALGLTVTVITISAVAVSVIVL